MLRIFKEYVLFDFIVWCHFHGAPVPLRPHWVIVPQLRAGLMFGAENKNKNNVKFTHFSMS